MKKARKLHLHANATSEDCKIFTKDPSKPLAGCQEKYTIRWHLLKLLQISLCQEKHWSEKRIKQKWIPMLTEIYISWINIKSHSQLWSGCFWDFFNIKESTHFSFHLSTAAICLGWKSVSQSELPAAQLLSRMSGKWKPLWSNLWLWFFFYTWRVALFC